MSSVNQNYKRLGNNLANGLFKAELIKQVKRTPIPSDEPKAYIFNILLENSSAFSSGLPMQLTTSGISFFDKNEALFKSLAESVERLGLLYHHEDKVTYSIYKENVSSLNIHQLTNFSLVKNEVLGWVVGSDMLTNKKTALPAQLIYLNYSKGNQEPFLWPNTSTGTAAGLTKSFALTNAIYELIERDAFILHYLTKRKAPRIDTSSVSSQARLIIQKFERYHLEPIILDITSDLEVPVYVTLLLDKTGLGPPISLGLKSSLDKENAILGSLTEAFLSRPGLRALFTDTINGSSVPKYNLKASPLEHTLKRAYYWLDPSQIQTLDFWLEKQPEEKLKPLPKLQGEEEKAYLIDVLYRKGITLYYYDLTQPIFSQLGFEICKVVTLDLQPFYMDENQKVINQTRLDTFAAYFNLNLRGLNPIPHPFL